MRINFIIDETLQVSLLKRKQQRFECYITDEKNHKILEKIRVKFKKDIVIFGKLRYTDQILHHGWHMQKLTKQICVNMCCIIYLTL